MAVSARAVDIGTPDALAAIGFILGWDGAHLPLFVDDGRQCERVQWVQDPVTTLARRVGAIELADDVEIKAGAPCNHRELDSVVRVPALWVWVEGSVQTSFAFRFRPLPSVVLRMGAGSRRLLLWALHEAVPAVSVEAANRRLAYALHAPQKWAPPEKLRVPLPGTFLRWGRARPVPVLVSRVDDVTYTRAQVVSRLREPPPADAWREKRRKR